MFGQLYAIQWMRKDIYDGFVDFLYSLIFVFMDFRPFYVDFREIFEFDASPLILRGETK